MLQAKEDQKKNRNIRSLWVRVICCLLFAVSFFVSCQSAPKVTDTFFEEGIAPLDTGASAYIFANVQEARPILDLLPIEELNDKQVRQMIDKTDFVIAALFPEESGRRFQIAAWGDYPSNAGIAFAFNKNWKKRRSASGYSYWYSAADKLSIAMSSRQTFIAASLTDEPYDPFTIAPFSLRTAVEIPEGFNSFRRGAQLSCWLENPAPLLSKTLNEAGVPIRFPVQQLFFNLNTATHDKYEAEIRIQFENTSQARGMSALLSLASGFTSNDPNTLVAALFFANPPVQNGRNIDIKTALLSEKEITLLLEMFLLY